MHADFMAWYSDTFRWRLLVSHCHKGKVQVHKYFVCLRQHTVGFFLTGTSKTHWPLILQVLETCRPCRGLYITDAEPKNIDFLCDSWRRLASMMHLNIPEVHSHLSVRTRGKWTMRSWLLQSQATLSRNSRICFTNTLPSLSPSLTTRTASPVLTSHTTNEPCGGRMVKISSPCQTTDREGAI